MLKHQILIQSICLKTAMFKIKVDIIVSNHSLKKMTYLLEGSLYRDIFVLIWRNSLVLSLAAPLAFAKGRTRFGFELALVSINELFLIK